MGNMAHSCTLPQLTERVISFPQTVCCAGPTTDAGGWIPTCKRIFVWYNMVIQSLLIVILGV